MPGAFVISTEMKTKAKYALEDIEIKRQQRLEDAQLEYQQKLADQRVAKQRELDDINTAYLSFGDNKLIEDLIIRNFLTKPNKIPTKSEMNADVEKFVSNTYKKLLNREPNEFEKWYLVDLIKKDATITPELFYYSILTSDEYRKY